jgi:hypothetical protein
MIQNYIDTTIIPEGHKVILVAHYNFFKMYTGEHESPGETMEDPETFIKFGNCQFTSDPTNINSV